ncbi:MAG TPA: PIN domain-containing protein [Thermoanaerobaculia bacterium]|nr:PIN domain-containing protein [Thermoanaerobaculia bacterium]
MSRGVLDTSILISQDDDASLAEVLPEESSISVVTLAELHYGVLVAKNDEVRQHRLRRLGVIEATFQPIAIDSAVARAFAVVANAVKSAGRQPRARVMDLWIAATALSLDAPVYTRNREDFAGLDSLIEVRVV